jgi:hypothetical protein
MILGEKLRVVIGTNSAPLTIRRDIGSWNSDASVCLEFGFKKTNGNTEAGFFLVSKNTGKLTWHNSISGVETIVGQ